MHADMRSDHPLVAVFVRFVADQSFRLFVNTGTVFGTIRPCHSRTSILVAFILTFWDDFDFGVPNVIWVNFVTSTFRIELKSNLTQYVLQFNVKLLYVFVTNCIQYCLASVSK